MKNEFTNRLGMFNTSVTTLNKDSHKAVWFQQDPKIFTTKVTEAVQLVADLAAFCQKQSTVITGSAGDKAREVAEAEDAAHPIARALVQWFRDQRDETNAAKVDLSFSDLRRLRDQELLAQLNIILGLAQSVTGGTQSTQAAEYGLTVAKATALAKEITDFANIINAPQANIADRKALTAQLRARFNEVEGKFAALDDLILNFDGTAVGHALVAAYQASRIVRDLGGSPSKPTPAPVTPTTTST
jgi:hypothetical protein